jgi:hypothetical protein
LRNGVQLGTADFTATNGTTVVLATGATAGDLITTISFLVSSVLNAIPATNGAVTTAYLLDGSVTAAKMAASGAWAPTGTVIQVVQATYSTQTSNSTTTYADSGLSGTITPKFSTSKILINITGQAYKGNGNASNSLSLNIQKNGSTLLAFADLLLYTATATEGSGMFVTNYLDSPATTSALTYKMQFKNSFVNASNATVQFQNMPSIITLTEIVG